MSGELSRPIIVTPLYVGGRAVTIGGHRAEALVEIYRYDGSGTLISTPIGDRQAPYAEWFDVKVPELGLGDHIFAKQTLGSEDSDNASFTQADEVLGLPVEILDEDGLLPAPYVYSPIYACGKAVKVYGIVHGALVEVYRREVGAEDWGDPVASAAIGCSRTKFNFRNQVEPDTEYMAIQRFPDIDSRESNIVPVVEYEGELPPPTILGQSMEGRVVLPACAPSFKVAGTANGATLYVYREGEPDPIAIVEGVGDVANVEVEYPPGLVEGWVLYAVQGLCDKSQESERAIVMGVEDYLNAFPPVIVRSLGPDGDTLTVQGAHESTIRIMADGEVIGNATSFGTTEVQLDAHVGELGYTEVWPRQSFVCNGDEIVSEGEAVPVDELLASEPLNQQEVDDLVGAHNDCRLAFRELAGLTPDQYPNTELVWSDDLAHWAQLYAIQLAVDDPYPPNCSPHSDRYTQRGDPHDGENLACGVSTIAGMVDVIKIDWCEGEGELYFDDGQPPIEELEEGEERNWRVWGHYTQVVWSNTTEVGCGRARSDRGTTYWVCQYRVGGNFIGQWPHGLDPSTL